MSNTHDYGPTNEPDTCLWCGAKLRTNYTMGERIEGPRKLVKGREGYNSYYVPTFRYINKKKTGKGVYDTGFFCTLFCGMQFGIAFARMGRRLQPKSGDS